MPQNSITSFLPFPSKKNHKKTLFWNILIQDTSLTVPGIYKFLKSMLKDNPLLIRCLNFRGLASITTMETFHAVTLILKIQEIRCHRI